MAFQCLELGDSLYQNGSGELEVQLATGSGLQIIPGEGLSLEDDQLAPEVIGFAAYSSASITASATPAKIQLATEDFDEGSYFDSVTDYRFVAPYRAIYHFSARVTFTTPGDGNLLQGLLYKNGAAFAQGLTAGGNNGGVNSVSLTVASTVLLEAADYVELFGSRATGSGNAQGMLSGHIVSRVNA